MVPVYAGMTGSTVAGIHGHRIHGASLGIGVWITCRNVKYRDFRYVIPFIVQLGIYVLRSALAPVLSRITGVLLIPSIRWSHVNDV